MPEVELTFDISDQVAAALERVAGLVVTDTKRAVAKDAADSIRNAAKSGRVYRRKTGIHQASAPGQAPANDTGALADSIHVDEGSSAEGAVLVSDQVAHTMEFGSPGGKVRARPFLGPAAEGQRTDHVERVTRAVRSVTNGK